MTREMALDFDNDDALYDFIVKKGNGIKGLVDLGISHVSDRFVQPLSERFGRDLPAAGAIQKQLPVIDLSKLDGPEHDQVVDAIVKAAETVGFFQVVNHGVPSKVLDSMLQSVHRFFDQSTEAKAAYLLSVSPNPQLVFYCSSLSPEKEKLMDWRDILSLIYTNDAEALQHWPDACKEEAIEYLTSTKEMGRRIFEILIENLKASLDSTRMESLIGIRRLNINYYPPCPNPDLTVGSRRHSDLNTLTLLLQDGTGGLQVKLKEDYINDCDGMNDEWIYITPIPHAFIVNIGDVFQILSNGHYKSAEHRVRTNKEKARVSVPVIMSPLSMEMIGPFPELVQIDDVARYKEVVYNDYRKNYLGKTVIGKTPLDFAKLDSFA